MPEQGSGLVLDGETVTNVFPYGPDGEPLQGVTLLDQDGDPLAVGTEALPGGDEYDANGRIRVQVPNWTEDGDQAWNVFPMGTALVDAEDFYADWYSGADTPGSALRPPYRSFDEATAAAAAGAGGAGRSVAVAAVHPVAALERGRDHARAADERPDAVRPHLAGCGRHATRADRADRALRHAHAVTPRPDALPASASRRRRARASRPRRGRTAGSTSPKARFDAANGSSRPIRTPRARRGRHRITVTAPGRATSAPRPRRAAP